MGRFIKGALRSIAHLVLMALFMFAADHIMRANADRVWRYTPLVVNLSGAVIYLLVEFLFRAVFRRRTETAP